MQIVLSSGHLSKKKNSGSFLISQFPEAVLPVGANKKLTNNLNEKLGDKMETMNNSNIFMEI